MAEHDLFSEFIDKLKKDKTPEEVGEFLADLMKLSSGSLYLAIMTQLSDEDMSEIDKITDEKKAQEEIEKRFKLKTGLTPLEFVNQLRDKIAKGYLFPELTPNK